MNRFYANSKTSMNSVPQPERKSEGVVTERSRCGKEVDHIDKESN